MTGRERRVLTEAFIWLTDKPAEAIAELSEAEAASVVKKGFVPDTLWRRVQERLAEKTC